MQFTEHFRLALQDYIFLLEKKYPEKNILELVSTRYALNHFERSILYRGISISEKAKKRQDRLITIEQLGNGLLHIDLFNVLFSVAAYLRGYPVYLSFDGLVRDASESHGSGDWEIHLEKGLELLIEFLGNSTIQKAFIYLDNPLEYGLAISEKLRELTKTEKPAIKIIADPSPDHLIRESTSGIIATSDSTIIDKSTLPVFDLPKYILESSFTPHFIYLTDI
jgi:hypothetical protein